jgi:hypothetical protein
MAAECMVSREDPEEQEAQEEEAECHEGAGRVILSGHFYLQ